MFWSVLYMWASVKFADCVVDVNKCEFCIVDVND